MKRLRIIKVVETCLYVEDVTRARRFYEVVLGMPVLGSDYRFCAIDVNGTSVLLLFLRGSTTEPIELDGGIIPSHDGDGPVHVGFAIEQEDVEAWHERLEQAGIAIEATTTWPRGGVSLYFRDPDNHLVELLTPGVWETY